MGCIYMRISPSGGKYVGQTILSEKERWRNHCKEAKYKASETYNTLLSYAIRKYGGDNFTPIILEDNVPDDKLNEREIYWIDYHHTYFEDNQHGYNMTRGGSGLHTIFIDSNQLLELWETGKTTADIALKFNCSIDTIRSRLQNLGITTTEMYKRRGEKSRATYLSNRYNDQELLQLWNENLSCTEISKIYNCKQETISTQLQRIGITSAEIKSRQTQNGTNARKIKILQIDRDDNIVAEWESVRAAARSFGASCGGNISNVLTGKRKIAYGYKWKYKENN